MSALVVMDRPQSYWDERIAELEQRWQGTDGDITITDLFCGAGGSSSGAIAVPGVRVRMAANHWKLAIETHNTNHPTTDHDIADLSQVDPRRYPRTTILWASPECTNWSQAKGKKRLSTQNEFDLWDDRPLPDEAAERSRATMWDVIRFTEFHRYEAVIVENVVDVAKGPLFKPWLSAMHALGYRHEIVWLNSMHAQGLGMPAPQSRDRIYIVFWKVGNRAPDFQKWTRPQALCVTHGLISAVQSFKKPNEPWGRYRAQYVYRCPQCAAIVEPGWLPAAAAIDWTLRGERIGDRKKPLADKTRLRIARGIEKYWRPLVVEAAGNAYDSTDPKHRQHGDPDGYVRAWPIDDALKTLHTTASKGLVVRGEGNDSAAKLTSEALGAVTAWGSQFLATPLITDGIHGEGTVQAVHEAMNTQTTAQTKGILIPVEGREGKEPRSSTEPMRTQSTRNETGIVIPLRANNVEKDTDQPLDTFAAAGLHHGLLMRNNTARGDQAQMTTPASEVARTFTANGAGQSLLMPYYGTGTLAPVEEPHRTMTTTDRYALIGAQVDVDECEFRMLTPDEIKRGMAFAGDYLLLGTKREQVRLAGNAVTPPAARDLIACVVESLGQAVERVA